MATCDNGLSKVSQWLRAIPDSNAAQQIVPSDAANVGQNRAASSVPTTRKSVLLAKWRRA